MKKNIKNFILLGLITLINFECIGQNAKEVLTKLNKTYHNKTYELNYTYSTSSKEGNLYKYSGKIIKDKHKLYLNNTEGITIANSKHHVFVDKMEKVIYINTVSIKEKQQKKTVELLSILDSVIDQSDIKLTNSKGSFYRIRIQLKDNITYESATLKINKNYQLVECVYNLKKNLYPFNKIIITYSNIKIGKKIKEKVFSTKSILIIKKNKIITKSKYSTYKIKDMRNTKFQ